MSGPPAGPSPVTEPTSRPVRLGRLRLLGPDLTPLRESRAFRWLWFGDVFSSIGREATIVAIPFQVYALTGSSLWVGVVSLVQLVPLIAGSLAGGVVVDAKDRRRVVLLTQGGLALVAVGLAVNATLDRPLLGVIVALAAVQAVLAGFDAPARRAALVNVVRPGLLPSALALQQVLTNSSKLLVPAATGVLIAALDVGVVYWLYAGAFLLALTMATRLPSLRPAGGGRKAGWSSLVEGVDHVRRRPVLQAIFLLDISAMVFGLPRALFPAIGTEVLGGDAATVGLLYAAPGAGALLGALTSGWLARVRRVGRGIVVSVLAYGLAITGFGLSPWLWLALAFLVASGLADMVSAVLRATLLQLSTPDELRGRVSSVNKAVVSGGPLLGDTRAGTLAGVTSAGFAIVSGGLACLVGVGLLAWRYRVLWHAELPADEKSGVVAR